MPVPQTKNTIPLMYTRTYSRRSVSLKLNVGAPGEFSASSPVDIRRINNSINGNRVTIKRPKASSTRRVLSNPAIAELLKGKKREEKNEEKLQREDKRRHEPAIYQR